jgi:hypothetical protein
VPIALDHLKVVDDLAFVPDVISSCNHVDVEFEKFLSQRRSNAEARRRVLSIRDDELNGVIADNPGQPVFDNIPSRPPKNVADKKNSHVY